MHLTIFRHLIIIQTLRPTTVRILSVSFLAQFGRGHQIEPSTPIVYPLNHRLRIRDNYRSKIRKKTHEFDHLKIR